MKARVVHVSDLIAPDLERYKYPTRLSAQELQKRLDAFEKNMQAKPKATEPLTMTRATFDSLSAEGRMIFVKAGGKFRD